MRRILSLGKRIKELRLKEHMSQVDLARGICTPSMISQIESDRARPSHKILQKICEKLQTTTLDLLGEVELNAESMSMYKMTRSMCAANDYAAAVPLLEQLLEKPHASISALDLTIDLANCHLHLGHGALAEKLLLESLDLTILRQDYEMAARINWKLGMIEYERKHFVLAVHYLQKAEGYLPEDESVPTDPEIKAGIYTTLAKTYLKVGDAEKALVLFEKVAAIFEKNGSVQRLAEVYAEMGKQCNTLRQYEKSSDYSDRSFALFEVLNQRKSMAMLRISRASLISATGNYDEAVALLETAVKELQQFDGDPCEIGVAYAELARVFLSSGDFEKSEAYCQTSVGLLDDQHVHQGWNNLTLAMIAKARDHFNDAINLFRKAAASFRNAGMVLEWSETMSEIAQLYKDQNRLEQSVEILKELRADMNEMLKARGMVL